LLPDSFEDYGRLGYALQEQGNIDEAVPALEKSLGLNSNQYQSNVNLGAIYLAQRRFEEALGLFRRAEEIDPNDATLHYNLGELYVRSGKRGEALIQLQILRALNPQFAAELEELIKSESARNESS
jgi:tetratricopeptide (TPR) repeat protein